MARQHLLMAEKLNKTTSLSDTAQKTSPGTIIFEIKYYKYLDVLIKNEF